MMLKLAIFAAFLIFNVASFNINRPCPEGVPMVMCTKPPCAGVTNPVCIESFCGTCKATCYSIFGGKPKPCEYGKRRFFKED